MRAASAARHARHPESHHARAAHWCHPIPSATSFPVFVHYPPHSQPRARRCSRVLRSPKNLLLLAHTCAKLNRTDEAKEWHRKCLEAKVVTPEDQQTVAEAKKLKF